MRDRRLHIVENDPPQALISDVKETLGGDRNWQVNGERHGEALKQQREARAGSRPRHGDEADAALRARDARRARAVRNA